MQQYTIDRSELTELDEEELRREWRERVACEQTEASFEDWMHTQNKPRKFRITRTEERVLVVEVISHSASAAIDRLYSVEGDLDFTDAPAADVTYDVEHWVDGEN